MEIHEQDFKLVGFEISGLRCVSNKCLCDRETTGPETMARWRGGLKLGLYLVGQQCSGGFRVCPMGSSST